MTLAAAVVLCMATTAALAYGAWRYPDRFPRLATLAAIAVPFALLALVLRDRPEARSGHGMQVVGQYAFLLDTVRIGAAPGADVRIPAPSSVPQTSGSTPKPKAMEVIRIGRNRSRMAASVPATRSMPCAVLPFANSMMSTAFLLERPTVVSIAIWKYTSRSSPIAQVSSTVPRMPSGTTISTDAGMDQLS